MISDSVYHSWRCAKIKINFSFLIGLMSAISRIDCFFSSSLHLMNASLFSYLKKWIENLFIDRWWLHNIDRFECECGQYGLFSIDNLHFLSELQIVQLDVRVISVSPKNRKVFAATAAPELAPIPKTFGSMFSLNIDATRTFSFFGRTSTNSNRSHQKWPRQQ